MDHLAEQASGAVGVRLVADAAFFVEDSIGREGVADQQNGVCLRGGGLVEFAVQAAGLFEDEQHRAPPVFRPFQVVTLERFDLFRHLSDQVELLLRYVAVGIFDAQVRVAEGQGDVLRGPQ